MKKQEYNFEQMEHFLKNMSNNWQDIIEIRALEASLDNYTRFQTEYVGFFNNFKDIKTSLPSITHASGIYYIFNQIAPECMAVSKNCFTKAKRGMATRDSDILTRKFILIDIDPNRRPQISSTDEQHKQAYAKAIDVGRYLKINDIEASGFMDSGNGMHIYISVDIPTKDDNLVKDFLEHLAIKFDDDNISIDTVVHNPARLAKLIGTKACKGSDSPDLSMPHRMAKSIYLQEKPAKVPFSLVSKYVRDRQETTKLDTLITTKQQATKKKDIQATKPGCFNLQDWLGYYEVECKSIREESKSTHYTLETCAFHNDHNAFLINYNGGGVGHKCFHNRCKDFKWQDYRKQVEGKSEKPALYKENEYVNNTVNKTVDNGIVEYIEEWDENPTRLTLPIAKNLTKDMVPSLIWELANDLAPKNNSQIEYYAIAFLSVIQAALGRKFTIKVSETFKIIPNNYTVLIGTSSQNKSKPLGDAMEPFEKIDAEDRIKYHEKKSIYDGIIIPAKEELSELEKNLRQNLKKHQNKSLSNALNINVNDADISDIKEKREKISNLTEPVDKYPFFQDASESALGNALFDNKSGVLLFNDELAGLIDSFNASYNDKLKSTLLETWYGNKSRRILRGATGKKDDKRVVNIAAACINILGSIQPDVWKSFISSSNNIRSGFVHRFQQTIWCEEPNEEYELDTSPINQGLVNQYHHLIDQLYHYEADVEHDKAETRIIELNEKAQIIRDKWHVKLVNWTRTINASETFKSHWKKYDYLMPGLALTFHMIENPVSTKYEPIQDVSEDNICRAIRLTEMFASHSVKTFGLVDKETSEGGQLIEILKVAKSESSQGELTKRNLMKKTRGRKFGNDVEENIKSLQTLGWLRISNKPKTKSQIVEVNPLYNLYYPDDCFNSEEQTTLFDAEAIIDEVLGIEII
jgi:hypothetical protein